MWWTALHSWAAMIATEKLRRRSELVVLESKPPEAHEGVYRMNFYGRVTEPSVKNCQLTWHHTQRRPASPECSQMYTAGLLFQFGKVGRNDFHVDFTWPLSPLQAFGICLAQFDSN